CLLARPWTRTDADDEPIPKPVWEERHSQKSFTFDHHLRPPEARRVPETGSHGKGPKEMNGGHAVAISDRGRLPWLRNATITIPCPLSPAPKASSNSRNSSASRNNNSRNSPNIRVKASTVTRARAVSPTISMAT